jgi:hypothetical protein
MSRLDDTGCLWPDCQCDIDRCARTPAAARPQWGVVEKILIGALLAVAVVCLWGLSWAR